MTSQEALKHLDNAYTEAMLYMADYRLTEENTALEEKAFVTMCEIMKDLFAVANSISK